LLGGPQRSFMEELASSHEGWGLPYPLYPTAKKGHIMDLEQMAQELKLAVQDACKTGTLRIGISLAIAETLLEILQELVQESTEIVYGYAFEKANTKYGP